MATQVLDQEIIQEDVLEKDFTVKDILIYTIPTVIMMVFMSMYTIIDGIFVSNYVSSNALSAVNITLPILSIVLAISLMFATGGNAIISQRLGKGDQEKARQFLTLLYLVGLIISIGFTLILSFNAEAILKALGTTDILLPYAKRYYNNLVLFAPMVFFQVYAQTFFVTAGKPNIGMVLTVLGGLTNIALDYVFIAVLGFGIAGAAIATGVGFALPGIISIFYFSFNRKGTLYFVKPIFDLSALIKSCTNGSSELVTNLSLGITTFFFNMAMLNFYKEDGVAAITIIMYFQMIQMSIYMGYSFGVAPLVGYKYGQENFKQLQLIRKTSFKVIGIASLVVIVLSLTLAESAVGIFVGLSNPVYPIAVSGLKWMAIAYLFMGFNVLASSMFTALGNGKISAIISFLRGLVFIVFFLLVLPKFLGILGVWFAIPISEILTLAISYYMYKSHQYEYKY